MTRRAMVAAALAAPLIATSERTMAKGAAPAASGDASVDLNMDQDNEMTYDNEAIVRHAYHTAEGNVLDVAGFVSGFAKDGVINLGHAGVEPTRPGQLTLRGEQIGEIMLSIAKYFPDVHRELHRVNVLGDTVAIELSIQGTFLGPLETPAGIIQPNGAKVDIPDTDFWYLRDGKIERFDCYIMFNTLYDQLGVKLDFSSVGATPAATR